MVQRFLQFIAGAAFSLFILECACRVLPVMSGWDNPPVSDEYPFVRYRPFGNYVYSQGWDLRDWFEGLSTHCSGFSSPEPAATTDIVIVGDSFVEASMFEILVNG